MSDIGYGDGYQYDHGTKDGFSGQDYFPDDLERVNLYDPKDVGFERDVAKRLAYWEKLRCSKNGPEEKKE